MSDEPKVLDGNALLQAFKHKHGIKSDEHALALMAIEAFKPERTDGYIPIHPLPGPYTACLQCGAWKKNHGPNGECPK